MEHQDWKPVVLKKNTIVPKSSLSSNGLLENRKPIVHENQALDMDEKKLEFFTPVMGKRIAALRVEKGWNQEQLAQRLNMPKKTITDIESGKEKYNGPLVSKLKRVLGNFSW